MSMRPSSKLASSLIVDIIRKEKKILEEGMGRPLRDLNTGPCDLQSHALTTELRSLECDLIVDMYIHLLNQSRGDK